MINLANKNECEVSKVLLNFVKSTVAACYCQRDYMRVVD